MTDYVTLSDAEKLDLLNEHSIAGAWPSLDHTMWCLHCEKEFNGHSVRVYRENGEYWLECGTPECDGSPIDWAPYPWWDDEHPLTKAHHADEMEEAEQEEHFAEDFPDDTPPTVH